MKKSQKKVTTKPKTKALNKALVSGSSLPRLFVAENQEFVIEGQIFTWYFSNKELRKGIVLNRKGMIEPSKFTVTVAKKKRNKKRRVKKSFKDGFITLTKEQVESSRSKAYKYVL
jgi:N-glycosylase/DNA lyase